MATMPMYALPIHEMRRRAPVVIGRNNLFKNLLDRRLVAVEKKLEAYKDVKGWLKKYEFDIYRFALDHFDWNSPALRVKDRANPIPDYQKRVLDSISVNMRTAVVTPHGAGKTTMMSIAFIHFVLVSEIKKMRWKIQTTASVFRQVKYYLWQEIRQWLDLLKWEHIPYRRLDPRADINQVDMELRYGRAVGFSVKNFTAFEGAHAPRTMFIFDESKAIANAVFDAAEGAFLNAMDDTGEGDVIGDFIRVIAASTPAGKIGRFYEIVTQATGFEDWNPIRVTIEELIAAGRASKREVEKRRQAWGADSVLFLNRILGKFAGGAESGIIPYEWVEEAYKRYEYLESVGLHDPNETAVVAAGYDIADSGPDSNYCGLFRPERKTQNSIIYPFITLSEISKGLNDMATMQVAAHAHAAFIKHKGKPFDVAMDSQGLGGPVRQRVQEVLGELQETSNDPRNHNAHALHKYVASRTYKTTKRVKNGLVYVEGDQVADELFLVDGEIAFMNLRAAMADMLRRWLDPEGPYKLAIKEDLKLTQEITMLTMNVHSDGKQSLIKKEGANGLREKLQRSPDRYDALVITLYAYIMSTHINRDGGDGGSNNLVIY